MEAGVIGTKNGVGNASEVVASVKKAALLMSQTRKLQFDSSVGINGK